MNATSLLLRIRPKEPAKKPKLGPEYPVKKMLVPGRNWTREQIVFFEKQRELQYVAKRRRYEKSLALNMPRYLMNPERRVIIEAVLKGEGVPAKAERAKRVAALVAEQQQIL
eukprot:EG_transcript_51575